MAHGKKEKGGMLPTTTVKNVDGKNTFGAKGKGKGKGK